MKIQLAVVSLWAEDVPANANFYWEVVGLKLIPQQSGRRSIRLKGYDYSQAGGYFIAVVTLWRECLY